MLEVSIQYEVDDQPVDPDALDEDVELADMLAHTGEQIRRQVADKLAGMQCDEHGREPRVLVTATYSSETGQMELNYHVDTCCPPMLLRAVQALNH
ncbi:MAG: hypothetical protein K8I60_14435 [Anaerolineae bacterium]|nr:hypothetical protein [Anaerolineae bacterium]